MIVFVIGLYKSGTSYVSSLLEQIGCNSIVDRVATTKGLTRTYDIKEAFSVNSINNEILHKYSKGEIYFDQTDLPDRISLDLQQKIQNIYDKVDGITFIKDPRFIGTIKYWIDLLPKQTPYKIVYVNREQGLIDSWKIDNWFSDKVQNDFEATIDALKLQYHSCKKLYPGIEIEFDIMKRYQQQLSILLYNYCNQDFNEYHKIYFHDYFLPSDKLTSLFKMQTPYGSGTWNNVVVVDDIDESDFEIVQDKTSAHYNKEKLIFFGREPQHVHLHDIVDANIRFHHNEGTSWLPQTWWVMQEYDKLLQNTNIDKKRLISVVDSGKGWRIDGIERAAIIDQLHNSDIDVDIFGKTTRYKTNKYKGILPERDKTLGLQDYRFNLCIENGRTPYYFSEKICDPIICNTFPIYYGCTNIDKFFPEGSYFNIDITKDVVSQVREIISIPESELDYDALFEAKDLILNKYNLWNTISLAINTGKVL